MYTPSPWNIESHLGHADKRRLIICAPDYDHRVAVISLNGAPKGDYGLEFDNANLISHAPDMYDALTSLVIAYGNNCLITTKEQLEAWAKVTNVVATLSDGKIKVNDEQADS